MALIQRPLVEVNLTEHCNLSCAGCNHSSPHLPTRFMGLEDFRQDLEALSKVLHVRELRLVGGEPLLHPQLIDFLRIAEKSVFCDIVTITTNGILLDQMSDELWGLIDHMIVSVYPGVKLRMNSREVKEAASKHGTAVFLKDTPEFMLGVLNSPIQDKGLVQSLYLRCKIAYEWGCHTVHEGRYYKCTVAPFLETRLGARGVRFKNKEVDGISLHNNPNLRDDLERYISSREPLAACTYCLGTSGRMFPHHQLNQDGRAKELAEDHTNPRTLLFSQDAPPKGNGWTMKNLAIVRAGDESRHETWLSDPARKNFDLLISYYGNQPGRYRDQADLYHEEKGLKYPWFSRYIAKNPWVLDYEAVWLSDDDIQVDTATLSDLFDVFHEQKLDLAMPALQKGSYNLFDIYMVRPGKLLRYVEFVHEQSPLFSGKALRKLAESFGKNESGWGLGIMWAEILGRKGMAIIDAAPVDHSRPIMISDMYTKVLPDLGKDPYKEFDEIKAQYGGGMRHIEIGSVDLDPSHARAQDRLLRQQRIAR